MRVFILLFNAGTDNEGVHSIQIGDRNVILMFEAEDDATRYALLLEAQDFPIPDVVEIDTDDIEELDYHWQLVPAGLVPEGDLERFLLFPPEQTVAETDWSVDAPPEKEIPTEPQEMSDAELERMRRKLEGLL
jgi:hypothetical protein